VDVLDVVLGQRDDEQAAMRLTAQQALLDETLHRFAEWAAAHAQPCGELRLAQLCAGGERAVDDGRPQLGRDDFHGRAPRDRRDLTGAAHQTASVRKSVPRPARGLRSPERPRPSQTLTWFAVSTGLPRRSSRASNQATVCSAVSGTRTASAAGWSLAATKPRT